MRRKAIDDPEWSKLLRQRTESALKDHPELAGLQKKLLSMGGDFVVLINAPDLDGILARGIAFDAYEVKLRKMEASHCHSNVAGLWNLSRGMRIATGWALSDDGLWRQHSWAVKGKTVIETTETRVKYFGYILTEVEAAEFWWNNC
jgi:hypothetical protein